VMIVTLPCAATSSAKVRPAIPLPMTRKSLVMVTGRRVAGSLTHNDNAVRPAPNLPFFSIAEEPLP